MNIFSTQTLQLRKPFGRTVAAAVLLLLIVCTLLEGSARLLVAAGRAQWPGVGTMNEELNVKISMLDALHRQHGRIDCIFLGSSQMDNALDPQVFTQAFQAAGGPSLTCFNFSLQTLTASPAGKISRLLVQRYAPRLLVYGTSARDYSTDFGEMARPLLDDPWLQYQLGQFRLKGWLTEHSLAYRFLQTLLDPNYHRTSQKLADQLTPWGYLPNSGNDLRNNKTNFIPQYTRSREDMLGLEELAALNTDATRILVLEVPVHPSFLPYYIQGDPTAYEALFIQPVQQYLNGQQVAFWRSIPEFSNQVPPAGWGDVRHLNDLGAKRFSQWLAGRLQTSIQTGEWTNPFANPVTEK